MPAIFWPRNQDTELEPGAHPGIFK